MDTSDAPRTETEVLERARMVLADRLPVEWTIRPLQRLHDSGADELVEVESPDGATAVLILEAKVVVEGRDVAAVREQLTRYAQEVPGGGSLLVARYLSPPVRKRLADADVSYVDTTGNVRVSLTRPGLFVSDRGANRDPWRGPGRPRGTLKGSPAAKVVRALADFRGPWTIRELIDIAGVSTGSTYRVIEFLAGEELAVRDTAGAITVPGWVALLRRWSDDYGFVDNSQITRWIAPRGLEDLMARAAKSPVEYAVTGTLAAAEWAAYAPARAAMIYTADWTEAAEAWGLRPAEAGANVMLAQPESDVVFARTDTTAGGLRIAAPTQVAVDLMTGPGRSPAEAEELIEWMTRNETSWRR